MANDESTFEILVGLQVKDNALYQRYRDGITPLLEARGGSFRYDFTIDTVLKSETRAPINRLFIISFPDARTKDEFFADETYRAIRSELFDLAVDAVTTLAEYHRERSEL